MSVSIRSAVRNDALRVVEIYVEWWNLGLGELMPAAVLDGGRIARWAETFAGGNWWVAEVDGVIAVDPPYWRQGLESRDSGRQLAYRRAFRSSTSTARTR